jgi:hypothetical protein
MNRALYTTSTALVAGLAAASFLLTTFNTGWIIREINSSHVVPLLFFGLLVPLLVTIIANVNEHARRITLISMVLLFEACCYVVITTMPNAGMNTSFIFDLPAISWYSLMIGSGLAVFMISIAELGRVARGTPAWHVLPCVSIAIAGLLVSASLGLGPTGWLHNVLLAMILQPASLIVNILCAPGRADPLFNELVLLHQPATLLPANVNATTKGGFMTLYMLAIGVHILSLVGLNGIGLDVSFFTTNNVVFYGSIGLGAVAGACMTAPSARRLLLTQFTPTKMRAARVFFQGAMLLQFASWLLAVTLDLFLLGYHGSILAQVFGGSVLGFNVFLYLAVVLLFHPPRSVIAYLMQATFCIGLTTIMGQALKAMALGSAGFESVQDYFPWVLLIDLVLISISTVLLLCARVPSITSNHANSNN